MEGALLALVKVFSLSRIGACSNLALSPFVIGFTQTRKEKIMIRKSKTKGHSVKGTKKNDTLSQIQPNAAGIDIGSEEHFVAIPEGRAECAVRCFSSFIVL